MALGEVGAGEALIARYQKPLFAFVLSFSPFSREQAFDIVVTSLVQCLSVPRKFVRDGEFFEALLVDVIDRCRATSPAGSADMSSFGRISSQNQGSLRIVREALIGLSEADKALLLLRDQVHLPMELIGSVLGTGPAARSQCLAARERLREAVRCLLERPSGDA